MVIDCWSICWELEYGTSMQSLLGYPDVGNHQLGLSQQGKRLKAIWSRTERYAQRFRECRKLALRSEKHDPKFIRSMSSSSNKWSLASWWHLASCSGALAAQGVFTALRVNLDVVTMVYLESGDGTSWFWSFCCVCRGSLTWGYPISLTSLVTNGSFSQEKKGSVWPARLGCKFADAPYYCRPGKFFVESDFEAALLQNFEDEGLSMKAGEMLDGPKHDRHGGWEKLS